MTYTAFEATVVYLLALCLIPLTIAAYALTHVIQAKDTDKMVRESHIMMRFCVKMAGPYFAIITLAYLVFGLPAFSA